MRVRSANARLAKPALGGRNSECCGERDVAFEWRYVRAKERHRPQIALRNRDGASGGGVASVEMAFWWKLFINCNNLTRCKGINTIAYYI